MSKQNKLLGCLVVVIFTIFSLTINTSIAKADTETTNYYGISMTDAEIARLLNMGFNRDEIYYMTEDIFEANKDLDGTVVAETKKYYKIVTTAYGLNYTVEVTPEEYYNHEDDLRGYVSTGWLDETSSIIANGSKYRFKNYVVWTSIPSNKSYDVIGIGFNGNIHIDNGISFYYNYTNSNGVSTTANYYFNKLPSSTGGTTTYQLPSNFVGLSTTMYFDVVFL